MPVHLVLASRSAVCGECEVVEATIERESSKRGLSMRSLRPPAAWTLPI